MKQKWKKAFKWRCCISTRPKQGNQCLTCSDFAALAKHDTDTDAGKATTFRQNLKTSS